MSKLLLKAGALAALLVPDIQNFCQRTLAKASAELLPKSPALVEEVLYGDGISQHEAHAQRVKVLADIVIKCALSSTSISGMQNVLLLKARPEMREKMLMPHWLLQ